MTPIGQKDLVYFGCVVLLLPALLINLGLMPLLGDEGIRSLVTLEMILRCDYITPTLAGQPYLNKPPLYNWILSVYFRLSGDYSEWMIRLPTVVSLFIYAATIFLYLSKTYSARMGFLAAFMFLTCGRIMFYDSMLGLIDITFSWLVFCNFILIYELFRRERFTWLFLGSYALTAATFLMKGIPALVFQGITLLVMFGWKKQIRMMFSWKHILGVAMLVLLLGFYYTAYYIENPDTLGQAFLRLFRESTQKTTIGLGWYRTLKHLFTFPFEMIYHFFPWFLFIVYLFDKKIIARISTDDRLVYFSLVFLANILVYWVSPDTFARYLLMLVPLAFTVFLHLHLQHEVESTAWSKIMYYTFAILIAANALFHAGYWIVDLLRLAEYSLTIGIVFFCLTLGCLFMYFRHPQHRLAWVIMSILLLRISFDLVILPVRYRTDPDVERREKAIQVAHEIGRQPLYLVADTVNAPTLYYLTRERMQLVERVSLPVPGSFNIIYDPGDTLANYDFLYHLPIRHKNRVLKVVKLPADGEKRPETLPVINSE